MKIEDGRLWMCFVTNSSNQPSVKRPTGFESGEHIPSDLLVLKRKENRREKDQ